ncbi:ribosome biogenesis GTPase YlqF [Chitinilyticum piscinae]|uniref:Ribosome biogenesis GTPase A n=1 Tax=Chitinilyticum piscinae TaxID=2866724 RepID=A0A8J7FI37_9NEIS|nr:ribosome biogenesis GTPase YlqF [Chitinilyticum piscinae]MBE9608192.1 ribosome biogenesis GTPase YlqF [Chitinilyticum piscinae]
MAIQWFPGHMHAARKKVAETMAKVDMVIEVVDARLPVSSCNPMINQLRRFRQRPSLVIINKTDMADPQLNQAWLNWFRQQPDTFAMLQGEDNRAQAGSRIGEMCRQIVPHRTGQEKPVRAMILGIPNVGKSTLMNALMKRKIANVADTPGVTKSQQRVELPNGTILYDTPGLLWPKLESELTGYRLALGGSIGRNAYDEVDVAWFAIETLRERFPDALITRYKLKTLEGEVETIFNAIARQRGAVMSGGRIDEQKAAELIITDFRSGNLGRLTLERPEEFTGLPTFNAKLDDLPADEETDEA